ncbi:MAG TPA: FtsX-like permease family protein [Terriglobales bacterium]|jgi:putative ABC transport system permease protein|nr:FtsX-like permease family protein [Terriglobales bacterium]
MKAYDLVELAGRNLRESVLRNSLTILGISVGVASLVAMLSLGIGLQQLAGRRLEKAGIFDTVFVTSRRDFRGFNRDESANAPAPEQSRALDEPARLEIERLPNVVEAYPDLRFITEVRYGEKPHLTMVAGLAFSAKDTDAFEGLAGTFFSSDTAPEAILQKPFAEELLGRKPKPGLDDTKAADLAKELVGRDVVILYAQRAAPAAGASELEPSYQVVSRRQVLKVVAISDVDPEGMRGPVRANLFLPLKLAQNLHVMQASDLRDSMRSFSDVPTYLSLTVRVKSPKEVEGVQNAIKAMGFNTFSILDASRSLRRFFAVLDLFLGIFGSLALVVASLGIINTLVMAILERRREIGIMKAVGGSDGDVMLLFFAEAGAMGLVGGVLGVALGWLIGRVINLGTNVYLERQSLPPENLWSVPWWLILGAIVFALLVSLAAGLYPASRAARLDPVQALRYE